MNSVIKCTERVFCNGHIKFLLAKGVVAVSICQELANQGVFSVYSDSDASKMLEFFLYYAASIDTSPLSIDLTNSLSEAVKCELVRNLCKRAGCAESDFIFYTFRNRSQKNRDLDAACLSDENFVSDRPKGFFSLYVPNNKQKAAPECEFDCIIKHIRNSLAHGRLTDAGKYAILEDKKKELTMRLVIEPSVLLDWADEIQTKFDL